MLQIEIDGKKVAVEQGSTVIEAAHHMGKYIPHFCYHKKLSIAANCRMCLVEVEKAPKPLPACATPVTDGMVVHTCSHTAKQAQAGVLEFLLINHPLDCPICDQGGECQLQDLSMGYGKGESRYSESKHIAPAKYLGPLVAAEEMSRCIRCTLCVRFTEEVAGFQELGMANRGEFEEIMPFIGKTVSTEISGNIIDLCPVGALTSKPFRYQARSWELSRRKSISAHDALGSHLLVQVKNHDVKRVLPLENDDINECWLSDRDRFSYEGLNHPDRLLTPKIKQDGVWHDVEWSTAFAYVVKALNGVRADHGVNGIGMWVNPANTVEELYLSKKLADGLGVGAIDSRLHQVDDRLEDFKQGALYLGQSLNDFLSSDAIWVIGSNMRTEHPLLTARIRKAAQSYAKLGVLNHQAEVLNIPSAHQNVLHPQKWVRYLKDSLEALKANSCNEGDWLGIFQSSDKKSIVLGADVQRHPDYSLIYALAQEIAQNTGATLGILPEAAGSVAADILGVRPQENHPGIKHMLDQPKKAVMLVNIEPDIDLLNGGVALECLKNAETVMAMTAYASPVLEEYADVLLPIAPFTETSGSFINMEGRLQSFYGANRPKGEARPLWKVLRVLGNVLELDGFGFNSSQDILDEALPEGVPEDALNNRINTLAAMGDEDMPEGLCRVGGVSLYHSDAVLRRADSLQKTPQAQNPHAALNARTLASLGFLDGDSVLLQQTGQTLWVTVRVNNHLPDDVVFLPQHKDNGCLGALMDTIELKRG